MAGKAFGKTKTVGKPVTGTGTDDVLDTSSNTTNTKINGGDGNDLIIGTDAADRVNAGDGDDTVRGGAGDDILFGNDGIDTAVFSGSILDYVWAWSNGNTLEVTGADGFDQLKHFEFLQFDDFTYSTDGNNAPVAVLRSDATTEENAAISLDVDLYDFDGDAVTVNGVSSTRGSASFAGQTATQTAAMGSSQGVQITFDPGTDFDYLAVGETTVETVTLSFSDSNGATTIVTYDILVTGTNDAPTLAAAAANAVEDGPSVDVDLSALGDDVDSDDDGSTLTYSVTGAPSEGSASITGTTLSFDPGADFQDLAVGETRDVVIQVTATDAHGATAVNDVTVTVTGTNDAPVAQALTGDVEENAHTVTQSATIPAGTYAPNAGRFYVFDVDTGVATTVLRDAGANNTYAQMANQYLSGGNGIVLQVNPNNSGWGLASYLYDGGAESAVNAASYAFTDPDGGGIYPGSNPAYPEVVVFADANKFVQNVSLTLTGIALSDGRTLDLEMQIDNLEYEVFTSDDNRVGEVSFNAVLTDPTDTVTVAAVYSDVDATDTHTISVDDTGTQGLVTDNGDGTFTYDANGAFEGLAEGQTTTDTFTYTVDDGNGGSDTETVTITVHGKNDGPTLAAAAANAVEDGPSVDVDLSALGDDVDSDDDGSTLTYSVTGAPSEGSASITGTTLSFDPGADFQDLAVGETRDVVIQVTATDAHGATAVNDVTVTVTGTNDAPEVVAIDAGTVGEDDPAVTIDLLAGQTDVDNGAVLGVQNIVITDNLGNPVAFTDNGDGTISIDPSQYDALNDGETRTLTVNYQVTDGIDATANTATLLIEGATDNHAPVANDDTLRGSFGGGLNVVVVGMNSSDITSTVNQLNDDTYFDFTATGYAISAFSSAADWAAAFASADAVVWGGSGYGADGANGSTMWNALVAFNEGGGGVVSTGWGHYTMGAAPSSRALIEQVAPFAYNSYYYTNSMTGIDDSHPITDGVTPFSFYRFWETTSTIDSGAISLGTFANGEQGIVALEGSGGEGNQVYLGGLYLAAPGYSQGALRSGEADQLFEQAVAWSAGGAATDEDTPLDIAAATLLANDTDADGDVLTISAVSATSALGATVTLNLDGSISYDPTSSATLNALNDGESLQDSFTYEISDGNGGTDTATVNLSVAGVTQEAVEVVLTFNEGINLGTYPGATTAPYQGFNFDFSGSYYANYSGFNIHEYDGVDADLEASSYYAPKYLSITLATGDEFEFVSAELADGYSSSHSADANELIVRGLNNGVELFSQNVVLSDSGMEEVAFNFSGIDELTFEVIGGTGSGNGVTNTGWYTVDDMTFLV